MRNCYQRQKNLGVKRSILFQSLIILYVLFLLVSQMTSPTTAYFNDNEVIVDNFSNATTFDEENVLVNDENQEVEINDVNQVEDAGEAEESNDTGTDTDTILSNEVIDNQKMAEPLEVVQPPLAPEMFNPDTQLDGEKTEKDSEVLEKR